MNKNTQITRDLIIALVASFTEKYWNIAVNVAKKVLKKEGEEDITIFIFTLQVEAEDHRKVVGKEGAHVKALAHLVDELGAAHDALYELRLIEPKPGPESSFTRVKLVDTYSPHNARGLMNQVLVQLLGPDFFKLTVHDAEVRGFPTAFVFRIKCLDADDYAELIAPAMDDPSGQTTVAALGTLFRAYANKEGTNFRVEAVKA